MRVSERDGAPSRGVVGSLFPRSRSRLPRSQHRCDNRCDGTSPPSPRRAESATLHASHRAGLAPPGQFCLSTSSHRARPPRLAGRWTNDPAGHDGEESLGAGYISEPVPVSVAWSETLRRPMYQLGRELGDEELGDEAVELRRLLKRRHVTAAVEHVHARAGDAFRRSIRVLHRDRTVVPAPDDQHRHRKL